MNSNENDFVPTISPQIHSTDRTDVLRRTAAHWLFRVIEF